jgi:hypothetical protein
LAYGTDQKDLYSQMGYAQKSITDTV